MELLCPYASMAVLVIEVKQPQRPQEPTRWVIPYQPTTRQNGKNRSIADADNLIELFEHIQEKEDTARERQAEAPASGLKKLKTLKRGCQISKEVVELQKGLYGDVFKH